MNQIYSNHGYVIYGGKQNSGFIVHNKHKSFKKGHTHISNFTTTTYLIYLSRHKLLPKRLSKYLIVSLIRISEDKAYITQLRELLKKEPINVTV